MVITSPELPATTAAAVVEKMEPTIEETVIIITSVTFPAIIASRYNAISTLMALYFVHRYSS